MAGMVDAIKERAAVTVAAWLPSRVRYWTFVQVGGGAIPNGVEVPAALFVDVLARVDRGR